jgi:hypothetical protein
MKNIKVLIIVFLIGGLIDPSVIAQDSYSKVYLSGEFSFTATLSNSLYTSYDLRKPCDFYHPVTLKPALNELSFKLPVDVSQSYFLSAQNNRPVSRTEIKDLSKKGWYRFAAFVYGRNMDYKYPGHKPLEIEEPGLHKSTQR